MKRTIIILACSLLISCTTAKTVVDKTQDLCHSELLKSAEVIAEATSRGVLVSELVDLFCGMVDVADIFTKTTNNGVVQYQDSPRVQAVKLLQSKGELKQ